MNTTLTLTPGGALDLAPATLPIRTRHTLTLRPVQSSPATLYFVSGGGVELARTAFAPGATSAPLDLNTDPIAALFTDRPARHTERVSMILASGGLTLATGSCELINTFATGIETTPAPNILAAIQSAVEALPTIQGERGEKGEKGDPAELPENLATREWVQKISYPVTPLRVIHSSECYDLSPNTALAIDYEVTSGAVAFHLATPDFDALGVEPFVLDYIIVIRRIGDAPTNIGLGIMTADGDSFYGDSLPTELQPGDVYLLALTRIPTPTGWFCRVAIDKEEEIA